MTNKKNIPTRSGEAQAALARRAPTMDHRNEPRGGTTNESRDLLAEEAPVCARCYDRGYYLERKPGTTATDDDEFTGADYIETYCECSVGMRKNRQGT